MGKKICRRPDFKEKMAAWRIGRVFDKGVELGYDSPYGVTGFGDHFVIIQKGKLVGDTKGLIGVKEKNGKKTILLEKLNKKYFPKLKCGLLSKKVKADVYSVTTDIYTYPTINCSKQNYNLSVSFYAHLTIKDPCQICNRLLEKTKSDRYTEKSLCGVYEELAKQACEQIIPTLSFGPCRLTVNKHATSKESLEVAQKFKYVLTQDFNSLGYNLSFD